jgi:hypothetical protein
LTAETRRAEKWKLSEYLVGRAEETRMNTRVGTARQNIIQTTAAELANRIFKILLRNAFLFHRILTHQTV